MGKSRLQKSGNRAAKLKEKKKTGGAEGATVAQKVPPASSVRSGTSVRMRAPLNRVQRFGEGHIFLSDPSPPQTV